MITQEPGATPPRRPPPPRRRLRDLGISLGSFPTGRFNAITDVERVRVGHATLIRGHGPLVARRGPVRTGVTAILPNDGNVFEQRVLGGGFVLNGAGEVSGLTQVVEWGLIETPILLTNTFSVGNCAKAVIDYMLERYPDIGVREDVVIPLVGECDDSWLNDIAGRHVRTKHVYAALDGAVSGPVPEGSVGGGTGMVTCDFKAGIGTSSRVVPAPQGKHTIGVLVMSNFGVMEDLRVDGVPVGRLLASRYADAQRRKDNYGSIIAVLATDAPLLPHQLSRLAKRVGLGIGRVGSCAAHGSGEIILAFSSANMVPRKSKGMLYSVSAMLDESLDPLYRAAIEATEEAILNALCMAEDMDGVNGRVIPALPLDELVELMAAQRGIAVPKPA